MHGLHLLMKLWPRIRKGIRKGKPVPSISRRQTGTGTVRATQRMFRKEDLRWKLISQESHIFRTAACKVQTSQVTGIDLSIKRGFSCLMWFKSKTPKSVEAYNVSEHRTETRPQKNPHHNHSPSYIISLRHLNLQRIDSGND